MVNSKVLLLEMSLIIKVKATNHPGEAGEIRDLYVEEGIPAFVSAKINGLKTHVIGELLNNQAILNEEMCVIDDLAGDLFINCTQHKGAAICNNDGGARAAFFMGMEHGKYVAKFSSPQFISVVFDANQTTIHIRKHGIDRIEDGGQELAGIKTKNIWKGRWNRLPKHLSHFHDPVCVALYNLHEKSHFVYATNERWFTEQMEAARTFAEKQRVVAIAA